MSYPSNLNFTYGKIMQDPSSETSGSNKLNIAANTATEVEYNFQMTGNASQNVYCFRVNNDPSDLTNYDKVAEATILHPPSITNQQLNFTNPSGIILTEGTSTYIYATATSTDANGYPDMVTATATVYRSSVSGGADCVANYNNCYQIPASKCSFSNCSGNQCDVSCRADIQYFADPTDFGTYAADTWKARITVTDTTNLYDRKSTLGDELNSLRALEVTSGAMTYNNGVPLSIGQDTGAYNSTTTTMNTGNTNIDVQVGAGATPGGTIPIATQKFATSTFVYSSCSICASLTAASNRAGVNMSKPTSTTSPITQDISFGISIPNGTPGGTLTGTNDFSAVAPAGP
jgi:hypothetical protein